MSELINYRLKVTTVDNRSFTGTLLAFDKHMNLVLSECEEARIPKKSLSELKSGKTKQPKELKRNLGLVILRGDQVVNVVIQNAPFVDPKKRLGLDKTRGGISRPIKKATGVKKT